ncbi:MAG TPA: D-alanine--D-alanine ligase [Bacillota bacterium]|nr:D-alanine--D-alanine ligase [Bacillota bacterium]HOL08855.1 D-alanine--D-alanine ligase [Bacillota bacterium]HPO96548.1 D-alanine--D-alanine ligase [Bacillota bacterium]
MNVSKIRVGLIFGGRSGEHEVSVLSANSVMSAINRDKYEVYPIGITKEGKWLPGVVPEKLIASGELQVRQLNDGQDHSIVPISNEQGQLLSSLQEQVDIFFPVMHGPYGEDGTIQGLLEIAGFPYVGGGVLASAVGMDKVVMKAVFQQAGLPVGAYLGYLRKEWESNPDLVLDQIEQQLGFPCFVKPANLGSSVGISKAHNREELVRSLNLAAEYDRKLIIEKMLIGREIECAVLGNDDPQASVVGEIVPCAEFYDYEAKYVLNDSKLIIPAELPEHLVKEVQQLAVKAFKAVDASGLGRVDFFVNTETNEVIINEINTMPGFTRISMYPKLWEASGINYEDLIDRLIQLGLERYRDKQRNRVC